MNNLPLISVIIPAYNIENYISATLDSVFAQTYENLEVITVDDGSKDSTPVILDDYAKKEPRLKVIHKENGGVTVARLIGVKAAKGEYIGFVDGDDLIDPDMYERLYGNAVKYNADISHCGYRVVGNDYVHYYYNTGNLVEQSTENGVVDLLEGRIVEPGLCNKLYRTVLFNELFCGKTLFDKRLVINEDLLMNFYLFKAAQKSIYEDFCPYQYIKRPGSASQSDTRLIDFEHPIRVRQTIVNECCGTVYEELSQKIYLSKTLHKLSELSESSNPLFNDLKKEMFQIVKDNRKTLYKLPLKQKFNGIMAIYCPGLFRLINIIFRKISNRSKK